MNIKYSFYFNLILSLFVVLIVTSPQISRGGVETQKCSELDDDKYCDENKNLSKNSNNCFLDKVNSCYYEECIDNSEYKSESKRCKCKTDFYEYRPNHSSPTICLECKESDGWTWGSGKCTKTCSNYGVTIEGCIEITGNVTKTENRVNENCKCTQCGGKYYKTGDTCAQCPDPYLNSTAGQNDTINKCYSNKINAGMFIEFDSTNGKGVLKKCIAGSYCTGDVTANYGKNGGIENCPTDFPRSDTGNSSENNCYRSCIDSDIANCDTYEDSGRVPKVGTKTCSCTKCKEGYELNNNQCLNNCSEGHYLPKKSTECKPCPPKSYCKGGKYAYNENDDQGIETCPEKYPNSGPNSKLITDCYRISYEDKDKEGKDYTSNGCKQQALVFTHSNEKGDGDKGDPIFKNIFSTACNNGCVLNKTSTTSICVQCSPNHWCAGGVEDKKYNLDDMKTYCKNISNSAKSQIKDNNSEIEKLWIYTDEAKGCRCPAGMFSEKNSKDITNCKYTDKTKFCFGNTGKCFTIKELTNTFTDTDGNIKPKGIYKSNYKVVY